MNTFILNGSPKGKGGNTEIFIRKFMEGAGQEYPVGYVVKEPAEDLAKSIALAETLLVFMPLYVHAMPGIVMKLFERMAPAKAGQRIGFVVQAGFVEGAQARFLVRYLNAFAERMGYCSLGIVTKGDAAGTFMMPEFLNRKLFKRLKALGAHYAKSGLFHEQTMTQLAGMYEIPPYKAKLYEFFNWTGIGHIIWRKFWRDNGVLEKGLDRPFASSSSGT